MIQVGNKVPGWTFESEFKEVVVSVICRMFGVLGLAAVGLSLSGSARAAEPPIVEIGMPKSLFQGIPKYLIDLGAAPFKKMMKANTGIDGNLQYPEDCMMLADKINEGKIHLGVFQGHEFAWAKKKYPDLMPIAVASPMQPVQVFFLVKWDCEAKNIGEFKNQKISLPPVHRDYCELYLAKQKELHMKGATFTETIKAITDDDAVQDVIDGKSACTVMDGLKLKIYENIYPGKFKNLKILCQSEVIPNTCIAIKKGELDPRTIEKFQRALINASTDAIGKPMLSTWRLKGFTAVPVDYDEQIKVISKIYPTPPTRPASVEK